MSRLAAVTFARELHCLNRDGDMFNITSQWQDIDILFVCFFVKRVYNKKKNRLYADTIVPKFRPDPSTRLKDTYHRKKGPAKLKPIDIASTAER